MLDGHSSQSMTVVSTCIAVECNRWLQERAALSAVEEALTVSLSNYVFLLDQITDSRVLMDESLYYSRNISYDSCR